jgi:integrase
MTAERNFWPGQACQADRRRARQHIVLQDVGITRATLDRYFLAVSRLKPILEQVSSETELDDNISQWVQDEFEDGCPLHMVGDALSGLHYFEPFTKGKLIKSWRLYSIWRRYEVPCRAPPLTQDLVLAMAGLSLSNGELAMAGLLLLGFHCLMRTGELLQLRPCDFILDKQGGLVSIPSSKSGVRQNTRESVSIHDTITLQTVDAMVDVRRCQGFHNTPCWDRSGSAFRNLFRRLLVQLEVAELNFRPYSLRRGGATYEMQSHGLMERTLIRGRWKNSNVARIYISDGLSMLPRLRMSWSAKFKVAKYSSIFINEHQAYSPDGKRGHKRKA